MSGHFYFEIQADEINRAIQFYKNVFDWKFQRAEGLSLEYWRIETGGTRGGLLKRPAQPPPAESGTNAFVVSMQVDNFDDIADRILKAGAQIALPKFPVPGICWQGYFVDTEGNTFGIFQPDENAK
jgi:predicted enzyme related to lactoylglutathione lyase